MKENGNVRKLIVASFMLFSLNACSQPSVERVRWEDLCIPKQQISWLHPGPGATASGPLTSMINHQKEKFDKVPAPVIEVDFSRDDLNKAIAGYKPSLQGKLGTFMDSFLMIKLSKDATKPHQEAYSAIFLDLWHLRSKWSDFSGSKIAPLPGTPYYKVIPKEWQPYGDSFILTKIDLSKHYSETMPADLDSWYVGFCGVTVEKLGFSCRRALLGKKYYIEYLIYEPNINLIPDMDRFMLSQMHRWAEACKSEQ